MKIDIIYTYYNGSIGSLNLLEKYIDHWNNNFNNVKRKVNFVIVDDHSVDSHKAINTIEKKDVNCNLQLYYVEDDILWNEMGARNLGGSQTTSDILLFLDWDHLITENLINEIFTWTFNNQSLYLFLKTKLPRHHPLWDQDPKTCRKVKDGTKDHLGEYHGTIHPLAGCDYDEWLQKTQVIQLRDKKSKLKASDPSAFCLSRELWYKVGGFDEDFAGAYGEYDRTFRKNLYNYKAKEITMNKAPLISLKQGRTRNVLRASMTERNVEENGYKRNRELYKKKTRSFYTPISPIRFKYTKQYEHFI